MGKNKYIGVTYDKGVKKWRAGIWSKQKWLLIGYFATEIEAAIAYDERAISLFGVYVRLNFPVIPEPEITIPNTKWIRLTHGKFVLVDDYNYEWLNQWRWFAVEFEFTFYACRYSTNEDKSRTCLFMHRLIKGVTDKKIQIDHIDRNGWNNMNINIRECTCQQNQRNKGSHKGSLSIYKGVSPLKSGKYSARIKVNDKTLNLGNYKTEIEAAKAYDKAAFEYFGEFAYLNFPEDYVNKKVA